MLSHNIIVRTYYC